MTGCIVCGGPLRTISEDGDVECVNDPYHGSDEVEPPPELVMVTADRCERCGQFLGSTRHEVCDRIIAEKESGYHWLYGVVQG